MLYPSALAKRGCSGHLGPAVIRAGPGKRQISVSRWMLSLFMRPIRLHVCPRSHPAPCRPRRRGAALRQERGSVRLVCWRGACRAWRGGERIFIRVRLRWRHYMDFYTRVILFYLSSVGVLRGWFGRCAPTPAPRPPLGAHRRAPSLLLMHFFLL